MKSVLTTMLQELSGGQSLTNAEQLRSRMSDWVQMWEDADVGDRLKVLVTGVCESPSRHAFKQLADLLRSCSVNVDEKLKELVAPTIPKIKSWLATDMTVAAGTVAEVTAADADSIRLIIDFVGGDVINGDDDNQWLSLLHEYKALLGERAELAFAVGCTPGPELAKHQLLISKLMDAWSRLHAQVETAVCADAEDHRLFSELQRKLKDGLVTWKEELLDYASGLIAGFSKP